MSDQRLIDTIQHKKSIGVSDGEIIKTLIVFGWKEEDILDALKSFVGTSFVNNQTLQQDTASTVTANIPTPLVELPKQETQTPRIFFDGEKSTEEIKETKKSKIIPAAIILFSLLVIAGIVIFFNISKLNPDMFSLFNKNSPVEQPVVPATNNPDVVTPSPEGTRVYGPYDSASKLVMYNDKFAFFYEKDGFQYVNLNGSISGPYQRSEKKGIPRSLIPSIYESKYGYSFNEENKGWSVNINGSISGPYAGATDVDCSKAGCVYAVKEIDDIYFNVFVNDKKYGPYIAIDNNIYISDNGFYGFSYISNSKRYVNMNGKVYGPYENVGNGIMYKNEKFYFLYSENGKQYVNVNGSSYESIDSTVYDYQKSLFSFSYIKDSKKYVSINGSEVVSGEQTELAQNHVYRKDDGYHVNINGQDKGIYARTTPIYTNNKDYIYGYQTASGQWYVSINGVDKGPYQNVYSQLFISDGHYGFIFQKEGTWSVEIK
ncbi:MAG: hypothetical protein WCX74_00900 [Candidatus Paceibacterota bacterium]